jgi:hypothetical protein
MERENSKYTKSTQRTPKGSEPMKSARRQRKRNGRRKLVTCGRE